MKSITQYFTFPKAIIKKILSKIYRLFASLTNKDLLTFSHLSELLHTLRSRELQNIPSGAQVFLSAGCAGRWYFDWINENYQGITRHLGVEAYSPQPEDLPDDVIWLTDYIYHMKSVADNDVDLVFAGQTVEHLWPDELTGFLCESYRVLKEDGLLVLDSPNQPIGKELNWHHPEHTMEFSVDEIVELVTLAGFIDIKVKGIWLCYDRRRKKYLPFEPVFKQINLESNKRITSATDRPEDSFIWWLEARKSSSQKPDIEKITEISQNIYEREYARNLGRVFTQVGKFKTSGDTRFIYAMENQAGVLRHGPYIPLKPGTYCARFQIGMPQDLGAIPLDEILMALQLKVTALNFADALAEKNLSIRDLRMTSNQSGNKAELKAKDVLSQPAKKMRKSSFANHKISFSEFELDFSIPTVAFGVEFIAITMGTIPITMKADVEFVKLENHLHP